ncbi:MAG: OmpA/MotB family protein [Desulfobacterales bacterium]
MAKRASKPNRTIQTEEPAPGGWQVVFSGFVLIMLCFFIMLSSFATMEEAKVLQFVEAFSSSVSILPGGAKLAKGPRILPESPDIVGADEEMAQVFAEIKEWAEKRGLEGQLTLELTAKGLILRFNDSLVFGSGSADLAPDASEILDEIGTILLQRPLHARVEGHTDNLPIQNRQFPSNWELSTARAVNVLRYFAEQKRIPANRLTAVGFSEFHPLAANDTEAGRAINRRVEIIFMNARQAAEVAELETETEPDHG